jgi:outer membrane protein assembly factor BamB
MSRRVTIAIAAVLLAAVRVTADWPQFLGPDRNGAYRGTPIVTTVPASGPKVVWSTKVGQGLAGPVVVGNRLILFHRVGDREVVESLDVASGARQWQYGYPTAYRDDFGFDEGPRAVPVVVDGIVYTFGAEGQLHAVSLDRGQRLWSENTAQKFGVAKGFFGAAGSPLVENGRVMANIGGSKAGIIAFSARKGAVEWTATEDAASLLIPGCRRDRWSALRNLSHARRPRRPRSRERNGEIPESLAGPRQRLGERGNAGRRRQPDLHLSRIWSRRRCAASRRIDIDRVVVVE